MRHGVKEFLVACALDGKNGPVSRFLASRPFTARFGFGTFLSPRVKRVRSGFCPAPPAHLLRPTREAQPRSQRADCREAVSEKRGQGERGRVQRRSDVSARGTRSEITVPTGKG